MTDLERIAFEAYFHSVPSSYSFNEVCKMIKEKHNLIKPLVFYPEHPESNLMII